MNGGSPGDLRDSFWCGIDWGGRFHHVCVLDDSGQQLISRTITHTVDGLNALIAMIASLAGAVHIAIE